MKRALDDVLMYDKQNSQFISYKICIIILYLLDKLLDIHIRSKIYGLSRYLVYFDDSRLYILFHYLTFWKGTFLLVYTSNSHERKVTDLPLDEFPFAYHVDQICLFNRLVGISQFSIYLSIKIIPAFFFL
jgi:hypothetical protein